MTRRLFSDLLLVAALLGAMLCVARGFLQSSAASFFGGWVLMLSGLVLWLVLRRKVQEPAPDIDDTLL